MLCCAVLCCAVLCCAVLCCAVLCCAVLNAVLCTALRVCAGSYWLQARFFPGSLKPEDRVDKAGNSLTPFRTAYQLTFPHAEEDNEEPFTSGVRGLPVVASWIEWPVWGVRCCGRNLAGSGNELG